MKPTVQVDQADFEELLELVRRLDWSTLGLMPGAQLARLWSGMRGLLQPQRTVPTVQTVPVPRDDLVLALCYLRRHRDGELVANNLDWEQSKLNVAALEAALAIPDRG